MTAIELVVRILSILLSLCYVYQVLYIFLPLMRRKKPAHSPARPYRYAILIAARNEEAVLPYLLQSIRDQDYPKERITTYVVADNCTDGTAEAARRNGAIVFSRRNPAQVGKGYALNYLLSRIRDAGELERYDAFLIFDADNLLEPNYITEINRTHSDGYEVFCGFRNTKNFGDSWVSESYGVWYLHDSAHMNQSRMDLGVCCAVSGTGFGFSRKVLKQIDGWRFCTLTEDIEFDTWCATHGVLIGYCPDAILYDEQPTQLRQSWTQRTRWVQGGIQIVRRYSGALLRGMARGGKFGYSSFETATLSLWGGLISAAVVVLSFVKEYTVLRLPGLLFAAAFFFGGLYLSMALMALATVCMTWDRIHAPARKKIGSIFAFPLFMLTYIPITVGAFFKKFQWNPIRHSVAVSVKRVAMKE